MSPSFSTSEAQVPDKNEGLSTQNKSAATAAADNGKSSAKHAPYLDRPLRNIFTRSSSDSISLNSLYSADNENERHARRLNGALAGNRLLSRSPAPLARTWKERVRSKWLANKGLALVALAQLFGAFMSVTTRLLELDGSHGAGMHPFQILSARMTGTLILSLTYQWLAKVENAPFGSKGIRSLLIARGVGGFFGVYGFYYSLKYLPMSDAIVITFLAPTVACLACSILIHEPFTRSEQVAGVISFLGVVLIARPASFLPANDKLSPPGSGAPDELLSINATEPTGGLQGLGKVTSAQRLSAVGLALLGILGAACAYTTIRWIGKRAHPLISVNYFAALSGTVSIVACLSIPDIGLKLPASLQQWMYLLFLGISGFIMQFLLTTGLTYEKSSRATNMVYTQMLFAIAFDKLVWNTTPGLLSIVGSSMILGSALYVAVLNNKAEEQTAREVRGDEEVAVVSGHSDGDPSSRVGEEPLRGVQEVQLRTLRV